MKTEHIVPLARHALEILEQLRAMGGSSRFVLPGRNRDRPLSNNTLLFALYRLGYKGKMTGHGFRAVASTILNETGFRADVIERQLAHCERNEVRGAYNRAEYLAERAKMMQHWANYLDGIKSGAKVVTLRALERTQKHERRWCAPASTFCSAKAAGPPANLDLARNRNGDSGQLSAFG